jgi:hypothetical protein
VRMPVVLFPSRAQDRASPIAIGLALSWALFPSISFHFIFISPRSARNVPPTCPHGAGALRWLRGDGLEGGRGAAARAGLVRLGEELVSLLTVNAPMATPQSIGGIGTPMAPDGHTGVKPKDRKGYL